MIHNTSLILKLMTTLAFFSLLYSFIYCSHVTKDDRIIKEDKNYLYVMVYDVYNTDSTVKKFHKPIIVEAKLVEHSEEKFHRVTMQNVRNGQKFNYDNKETYEQILKNKNKTYKFKYVYYPRNKEGYYFVN